MTLSKWNVGVSNAGGAHFLWVVNYDLKMDGNPRLQSAMSLGPIQAEERRCWLEPK